MHRVLAAALFLCFALTAEGAVITSGSPSTTNNDDSCDISVLPAATLLLPFFEVDTEQPVQNAVTTLFTVINTTQRPQIARVTLWTDYAYPVMTFNVFLTGYDVQAFNLYDVLKGSNMPHTTAGGRPGARSLPNNDNPNFLPDAAATCADLPGAIPQVVFAEAVSALRKGVISSCATRVGGDHNRATGYVTIDVVATCHSTFPTEPAYMNEILYDNVLSGDYEWIDPRFTTGNYAGGNPLVHIRAVPEGGKAGEVVATNLPYTFYDRLTPHTDPDSRTMDRRQPLPSAFSSRSIEGGTGGFQTELRIWREVAIPGNAPCSAYGQQFALATMRVPDLVRFDEHENAVTPGCDACAGFPIVPLSLPATSSSVTTFLLFPNSPAGDVGGWLYLNLDNRDRLLNYKAKPGRSFVPGSSSRPSQNWVVTSMFAEGRFQVAYDALMLANGCTPGRPVTNATTTPIGPGPNTTP